MKLRLPSNGLVVLVGPSGSGKSTFAQKHFDPQAIISTDSCRKLLSGTLKSTSELQEYSEGAFVMFYAWIRARLRHNLLAVADSTALRRGYRDALMAIAREEHVKVVFLFFDTKKDECVLNDAKRIMAERVGEGVIKKQFSRLNESRGWLRHADEVYPIKPTDEVEIEFTQIKNAIESPAIDVIGDVHGCYDELIELIEKLGYTKGIIHCLHDSKDYEVYAQNGRRLVFVGDLIDRGPESYKVLDFVKRHVEAGVADLVLSNHEKKFRGWLSGKNVLVKPEFQKTLDALPADLDKNGLKRFFYNLKAYRTWDSPDGQKWVVAHAAFDPKFLGKMDKEIEDYCIYGPVESVDPITHTPKRIAWWEKYRSKVGVVYGHVAAEDGKPRIVNGTWGIDTGCVHGLNLTALRLPEREIVQVKARQIYSGTALIPPGKEVISESTYRLPLLSKPIVTVKGLDGNPQSIFIKGGILDAIDTISTRTISPDKLMWLSPTMSPGPVSSDPNYMEDPVTTAEYMLLDKKPNVHLIAEEKHMGSRGTWRCELVDGKWEITCWTRNGFEMFDEPMRSKIYSEMQPYLSRLSDLLSGAKLIVLDSEVMPWNQHGAAWLENVFMTTAAAGHVSRFAMARASKLGKLENLVGPYLKKIENLVGYSRVANQFCWTVKDFKDLKIGFFDILLPTAEVKDVNHTYRLGMLSKAFEHAPFFRDTQMLIVDGTTESLNALDEFWDSLTEKEGIEGVVLKFDDPNEWSSGKYPQQQLKVRGKEYLRLIYGPNYLDPEILPVLRKDRKIDFKLRMAYQETLLGREALARFSAGESFERWHECVISIMAADRASIDPRL